LKDAAARSVDNVLEELETSRGGLTSEEAARRLAEHGPNTLVEKKQESGLRETERVTLLDLKKLQISQLPQMNVASSDCPPVSSTT